MSALRGKAEVEGGAALAALRHRDIDAPDLALGADLHRLLVAGVPQRHAGGKSRSLDEHLDLASTIGCLKCGCRRGAMWQAGQTMAERLPGTSALLINP